MREYEHRLAAEFKKGLKPFANRSRNAEGLSVCLNQMPYEEGIKPHETVVSLNDATKDWGADIPLPGNVQTRDITIHIADLVSDGDIEGAMVYLDGELAGTSDAEGNVDIAAVALGGHNIKITAAGHIDSDLDYIYNDFIMVV